ncbi:MAG: cysteine hydrolase [Chloroflexi bacterium]|nr:cysteine hydrolase [Chloroflexota bacterium]
MTRMALIVIDIQKDFWQPLAHEPGLTVFPENVHALLATARRHGLLVVHTQAIFQPDRSDWMLFYRPEGRGQVPCIAGTPGVAFEPFAAPLPGEPVIQKQTFDGFAGTGLADLLAQHGIRAALIAGLETSVCVLFTATSAYLRRIVPLVVRDACGDSADRHAVTLQMYDRLSFQTVTTDDVVNDLDGVVQRAAVFTIE